MGTLLAGYRLWSGYTWPSAFASPATCCSVLRQIIVGVELAAFIEHHEEVR